MTFEEFDYVEVDYDEMTFTIEKEGHSYTYDISEENELYSNIMQSDNVDKYEVYSQEEDFDIEEDEDKSIDDDIHDLWDKIEKDEW